MIENEKLELTTHAEILNIAVETVKRAPPFDGISALRVGQFILGRLHI